jgi:hypothetical protein
LRLIFLLCLIRILRVLSFSFALGVQDSFALGVQERISSVVTPPASAATALDADGSQKVAIPNPIIAFCSLSLGLMVRAQFFLHSLIQNILFCVKTLYPFLFSLTLLSSILLPLSTQILSRTRQGGKAIPGASGQTSQETHSSIVEVNNISFFHCLIGLVNTILISGK